MEKIDCFDDQKVAKEMDAPGAILKKIGNAQGSPFTRNKWGNGMKRILCGI